MFQNGGKYKAGDVVKCVNIILNPWANITLDKKYFVESDGFGNSYIKSDGGQGYLINPFLYVNFELSRRAKFHK